MLLGCLGRPAATAQSDSPQPPPAQSPSSSVSSNSDKNQAEITSHEEATTFKVNVKLVLVRVVVRDAKGNAVGTLHKEDFELFDNRKPQVISQFAVERPGTRVAIEEKTQEAVPGQTPALAKPPAVPESYTAYLFDDVHLKFGDLAMARKAAERRLDSMPSTDRAAIFSTSGQTVLDFTDDRSKLREVLDKLQPRPIAGSGTRNCPDLSYYMADLIQNQQDLVATQVATLDTIICLDLPTQTAQQAQAALQTAQAMVRQAAEEALSLGDQEGRVALSVLRGVVRRLSVLPGQRSIVLVSPGFLAPSLEVNYQEIIDLALRTQVMVSTLDARGLYAIDPLGDISKPGPNDPVQAVYRQQYATQSASAESDVLMELANGTGGTFFHNSNDLDEGFRRVGTPPEYYYVLSFSPQNLKLDGSFHALKVSLKNSERFSLETRRGYYAPKRAADPAEEAKQEIEDEIFSNEELHDLPVELHTQFFKTSDAEAKLTVVARVDVKRLRFRKVDGRNRNDLTVVSALFNRDGNYVQGNAKVLEMRLKDETLEHKLNSGVTLRSSFDVKPGSYLVRLIVRDAEAQQMAAENGAVEIP
jgi:VWFA-related protein